MSVQDSSAVLHVGSSPGDLSVDLTRLGEPDAKEELRKLLFRMGDSLTQLNSTGKGLYRLTYLILNEIAGLVPNMFYVRVCTLPFNYTKYHGVCSCFLKYRFYFVWI